ncbi:alpha/beta fold hydrolase [Celeribacter neptunius]|uniref:Pimeloyl-ACP methyl ester carboxylesterase n=1 Tax=Celeribacter neptunius TaxID=588602 RepID=A0A1I3PGQ4_9RHOB|nr:alpha/beta fold hydrolase [Celeribacter neptunius]SFJ20692.1 Pimeloyl-ACP methyl ester carboxylesterase [Celeribacter neptunius]
MPPPDDILSAIYDVALSPECYARLLPHMDRENTPMAAEPALPEHLLLTHFIRAEEILDRGHPQKTTDEVATLMGRFSQSTALLVNARLEVLAVNGPAEQLFGIAPGAPLSRARLPETTRAALLALIKKRLLPGDAIADANESLLELQHHDRPRPVLLQLHVEQLPKAGRVVLILSSDLIWPEGFETVLASAFGLTPTETEVIRRLINSENIQEIAKARGRSVDTIRTQVKTILGKTDTRSQAELIRIVLMMMHMATGPTARRNRIGTGAPLQQVQWHRLTLRDGRRMSYRDFGAPEGRPVVVWPMDYGFTRWSPTAEARARTLGLRVILPLRGGYGSSDMPPLRGLLSDHYARDIADLMDHLALPPCPHLTMGVDLMMVARFAALFPERITGLISCAAIFPITEAKQIRCMDKWHRMILATARNTPRLLPFLVKAGFALALRAGKDAFMHNIFADAPGDLALLDDPETREALFEGTHYTLSKEHNAADIFTRTTIEQMTRDWRADLQALVRHVPVQIIQGREDTEVPPEMLAEHMRDYPEVTLHLCEDGGRFVFFRHWQKALELLDRLA